MKRSRCLLPLELRELPVGGVVTAEAERTWSVADIAWSGKLRWALQVGSIWSICLQVSELSMPGGTTLFPKAVWIAQDWAQGWEGPAKNVTCWKHFLEPTLAMPWKLSLEESDVHVCWSLLGRLRGCRAAGSMALYSIGFVEASTI